MPRPLALVLALLALVASVTWVALPVRFELRRPRLGIPAVLLAGETFQVELRSSVPGWRPAAEVRLIGVEEHLAASRELSRVGARRVLEVTVPGVLEPGGYDVEVEIQGVRERHPRAVHVLSGYADEITIIQLADLPTFGGDGSGDRLMETLVEEINLIDPDLVLVTGDIAYTGRWEHFRLALEHFEKIEAPAIVGIGNHEYKGLAAFFTLFGEPRHVIDVGGRRIVTLNSGHGRDQLTESQYAWFAAALEDRGERDLLVQVHHPLFWQRRLCVHVDDLVDLCREHEVPIVFSGHWHGDHLFDDRGEKRVDTWDFEGTKFVVTTAAGADLRPPFAASPVHHGYRLIRMSGNRVLHYTYDWDGDGERDACCSIPVGKLRVEPAGEGRVLVHNELFEAIPGALVPIWTDGAVGGLDPDRGELVGDRLRYHVRVDLPPRSVTPIQLGEN